MNPARGRTPAVVVALVLACFPTAEAQAPPDVIRVPLSRNENHVAGVGVGLTFDKDRVAKAMAAAPLTLPDPLPPGTVVGFNSEADMPPKLEDAPAFAFRWEGRSSGTFAIATRRAAPDPRPARWS